MAKNTRAPLSLEQLQALEVYSRLQENLVDVLIEHGATMKKAAVFALEDALLAALKPDPNRGDFVELSMLSSGAPHLIRAVERAWPNSWVFVDQFQNPEALGVSLSMIIHQDAGSWPSIADTILDSNGRVPDPLAVSS